jgi:hypothetical protein
VLPSPPWTSSSDAQGRSGSRRRCVESRNINLHDSSDARPNTVRERWQDVYKTASEQSFGGRRIAQTMMALLLVPDPPREDGKEIFSGKVHTAVCIEIKGDKPVFRSMNDLELVVDDYEFAPSEQFMHGKCWTWKERV